LEAIFSTDGKGLIECWRPQEKSFAIPKSVDFSAKSATDFYALCKLKTLALSSALAHNQETLALFCADDKIRLFKTRTGKLLATYDESTQLQVAPAGFNPVDIGRRVAIHQELIEENTRLIGSGQHRNHIPELLFDQSDTMLIYGSLFGIKVINTVTNKLMRLIGTQETDRYCGLALYQGRVGSNLDLGEAALHQDAKEDPTLMATVFSAKSVRFFLFTRRLPVEADPDDPHSTGRDILNERPQADAQAGARRVVQKIPEVATIHTSLGDIRVRLFPQHTPKTHENFIGLANNGYYEGLIFHRIIRGFMIQTGDPAGDGSGGESLWGGDFQDEFHPDLKHDRPGVLSMANTGAAHSNASQFFITTVPIARLDGKHTVFGRVEKGMDIVMAIEKVDTDRDDKPYEPAPKIISISVE
jgi:peptidylprolyl isomerase domain and WD repeat-containing protein 1